MEIDILEKKQKQRKGPKAPALDVTVSQSSIQVARGQAAILPCSFTTSAALTNLNIIWMVIPLSNANQPEQVIIYQGGQVFSLANHLNGRVGFVATMPSTSASIFINNTQLSDTGTYQCLVNNLPDRGGRNIGVIGLTVLVPPSVPACRIQGTLDVGSDIMLICSSEEGIPTPSYSWEKLDALPKLPHNAMQDQMQGTVTLRNISTSTSGLYQCTSSNAIGKSTCLLNLQVLSVCTPYRLTLKFLFNREDDLPPKRSSSVKAFHADASSSENDTLTSTNTYNSRYWHNPNSVVTPTAPTPTAFANGSHTLPPPKTLVVTTNSAPSPPTMVRSNGSVSLKPVVTSTHGQHTHSYAVSQATLERMGAVPVMVPAQSRAGSLV
uniref:Immunoglobulin superfamily member 11 n=1 Tax=Sphaeramia orbicularis TaxID=375764 RepID=A0A673A4P6_9TELE